MEGLKLFIKVQLRKLFKVSLNSLAEDMTLMVKLIFSVN